MRGFFRIIIYLAIRSFRVRVKKNLILAFGIIGTAALMLNIEAFINGISETMINNSVRLHTGHITVDLPDNSLSIDICKKIEKLLPEAKVFIRQEFPALVSYKGDSLSVRAGAINSPIEKDYSVFARKIIAGNFPSSNGECMIGKSLADSGGIKPGEIFRVSAGKNEKSFQVSGVFETSIEELDNNYLLMNTIFSSERVFAAIYLENSSATENALNIMRDKFKNYIVLSWEEKLTELYQLITLNKKAMNITEFLVLMIITFSIAGMVSLAVLERYKEIALLKLKGFNDLTVAVFIIAELMLTAFISAAAGLISGYLILMLWQQQGINLSEVTSANRHFLFSSKVYPLASSRIIIMPFITVMLAAAFCSTAAMLRALRIKSTAVIKGC